MGPLRIIVATARNRVIGREGKLPWSIPEDFQFFCQQTQNGAMICGRNVYLEMETFGLAEPEDREFHVVSRNRQLQRTNVTVHPSFREAHAGALASSQPAWVIGGARIYEAALPIADELYLTQIQSDIRGDTYFPDWSPHFTKERSRRSSSNDDYKYDFVILGR